MAICLLAGIFGFVNEARAEDVWCYFYDDLHRIDGTNYETESQKVKVSVCKQVSVEECVEGHSEAGHTYDLAGFKGTQVECGDEVRKWNATFEELITQAKAQTEAITVSNFIPQCLLSREISSNSEVEKQCRDVGIFIIFGINVARYISGVMGALALAMFVYGGFTLILSSGNPEKVKKGTEIIVAAVIGLLIIFAAYLLINWLSSGVAKITA